MRNFGNPMLGQVLREAQKQRAFVERAVQELNDGIRGDDFTKPGPVGSAIQLSGLARTSAQLTDDMTPNEARRVPQAIANPGIYGDMVSLLAPLAAATDFLAVARPKTFRPLLIIINNGVGNLYIDFDKQASLQSLPLVPGGILFMDAAVPQNDIHLFSAAAVNIPVFYMNTDPINAPS